MLCLYILPVGYAIVWVKPSWDCGPFSGYEKIYQLATKQLTDSLPDPINKYCSIFYLKKKYKFEKGTKKVYLVFTDIYLPFFCFITFSGALITLLHLA